LLVSFDGLWDSLLPIGRERSSRGYRRFAWSAADLGCREWFVAAASERGLDVETDGNGNLWGWWGDATIGDAVVVGSHLDSVPDGGPFDGPLGVVSAFAAIDVVRSRGLVPARPVGVVAFSDEEGARFGVACVGSRLLTGALPPERVHSLTDDSGTTVAEAMRAAGHDPAHAGPDTERLGRIGWFVELHVEQGRARPVATGAAVPVTADPHGLVDLRAPVGVATGIWPHGRWRIDLPGCADHAGTTRLADRADPMLVLAAVVLGAREAAVRHEALATVGKVEVLPGGVNAIPSHVTAWLDARGEDEARVRTLVADVTALASGDARPQGSVTEESWTPPTAFDVVLRDRIAALLGDVPLLPTAAGHDAGVLATAGVRSCMLFVRNPTGVSHSPAEHADRDDCLAGVDALARVIEDLAAAGQPT
jgi:beta-ureidopropionase / N-carbamoyl-L-amino-acid hydrolase